MQLVRKQEMPRKGPQEIMTLKAYTVTITSSKHGTHYKRTVTSESLPRVTTFARSVIDAIWNDLNINAKGQLIITNADTGEICWTENITPFDV